MGIGSVKHCLNSDVILVEQFAKDDWVGVYECDAATQIGDRTSVVCFVSLAVLVVFCLGEGWV